MKCPYCNQNHPNNAKFCPLTGQSLGDSGNKSSEERATPFCPNCSKVVPENTKYCPFCGYHVAFINDPGLSLQNRTLVMDKKRRSLNIVVFSAIFGLILIIGGVLFLSGNDSELPNSDIEHNEPLIDPFETIDINQFLPTLTPTITPSSLLLEIINNTESNSIEATGANKDNIQFENSTSVSNNQDSTEFTSTLIITPSVETTNTPEFGEEWIACPGLYPSRIQVGYTAKVSEDPPLSNRVRSNAGTSYSILGYIEPGERVTVFEGPACANSWIWWKIRSDETGLKGWTVEGDGEDYWLIPVE